MSREREMSRKGLSAIVAVFALISAQAPVRAYTLQYRDSSGIVARRWLTRPIIVAFSTSLSSPPANIKSGSDVIGAAHRALDRWASVANIQFFETRSTAQTISPPNAGDGVNLITVSTENATAFGTSESPGRTRVFYDSGGAIVEADIALNPTQLFSTDGTFGTYDLESTFTHEVGHLLGLEHSAIIGATMQPRQAKNGVYGLPAFTQRTLSEDDEAGARALYGSLNASLNGLGSISGRLIANGPAGQSQAIFGGHVFAEDTLTGRVIASSLGRFSSQRHRPWAVSPDRAEPGGASRCCRHRLGGWIVFSIGGNQAGVPQFCRRRDRRVPVCERDPPGCDFAWLHQTFNSATNTSAPSHRHERRAVDGGVAAGTGRGSNGLCGRRGFGSDFGEWNFRQFALYRGRPGQFGG
jgi:hypothetical protein